MIASGAYFYVGVQPQNRASLPCFVGSQGLSSGPERFFKQSLKLDFSHLRSKGVGYALHQFAQRKVIDAHPTGHDDTDLVSVRTTILKARLATRPSFACGSDPCTGQANRQFRPTCGGLGPTGAVPPLPSGTQPCHLVAHKGEPHPSGSSRADVHTRRSVGCGYRRDIGTTPGEEDRCKGSLSRPRMLNPRALRKDERPQMDLRGAFGGGYVGFSGLGPAVSVGVGLLRTLCQRAGQAAQETDRVGVAATSFGEALVPKARDRRRR